MADTRDEPAVRTVGAADRPWVELRIHGVSGTPPESMLESVHVRQVAGDAWGRFFRPVDGVGEERQAVEGRILEGYHWGRYTSGSWLNGLWLILIPFGLVNAAAFMVPDPGSSTWARRLHTVVQALIRSIGVGVTGTFALAAALISVDLIGRQWAATLPVLKNLPVGSVMAGGGLLAAGAVAALFWLGNQNRAAPFSPAPPGSLAYGGGQTGLRRESFFKVDADTVPILGLLHLSAGWCVTSFVGALTWRTIERGGGNDALNRLDQVTLWTAGILLWLIGTAVMCLGDPNRAIARSKNYAWWHDEVLPKAAPVTLGMAVVPLVFSSLLLTQVHDRSKPINFDEYARWLALVTGLAMACLLVVTFVLGRLTPQPADSPRPFRRYAGGMAPWAAASVGVFLGVGFCAAFVLGVAHAVGADAQTDLIYRISYSWGLTVLLGIALGVLTFLRWAGVRWASMSGVATAYAKVDPPCVLLPPWPKRVAGAMSAAALKLHVDVVFLAFATAGLAMTTVTSLEMFRRHTPGWAAWLSHGGPVAPTPSQTAPPAPDTGAFAALSHLGTYVLIALAGLLLLLGRRALRTETTRRGINVVWDVVSFWPHSAHPFVPPAYSQFAVHDLRRRIRFHLGLLDEKPEQIASSVVVSAHSQGSLITFATMLWLSDLELERVGLVTYGSQLQVAFPRGFPTYVNYALLEQEQARLLGHWVNLYRETDPIAGPVLSWGRDPASWATPCSHRVGGGGAVVDTFVTATGRRESGHDWRVLDPPPVDPQLQLSTLVSLSKHSGYPGSVDYAAAVAQVRRS
jgi:hypothetical protein